MDKLKLLQISRNPQGSRTQPAETPVLPVLARPSWKQRWYFSPREGKESKQVTSKTQTDCSKQLWMAYNQWKSLNLKNNSCL